MDLIFLFFCLNCKFQLIYNYRNPVMQHSFLLLVRIAGFLPLLINYQIIHSQHSVLFNSDEPLEIVLNTDVKRMVRSKPNSEEQEGTIIVLNEKVPVRLKARSNYIRGECIFPPVELNFNKTHFANPDLDQIKKMKLVNACKDQNLYEQYLLREYLIYKIFNLLTDKSLKVRLLKVNFMDVNRKIEPVMRYGFVLEDQYAMARRLGGMMIKKEGLNDLETNREQMVLLSIFQFLIGNTEWQVSKLHNLILLRLTEATEQQPYVIPFDFDYSGMVNAEYAIPSRLLGIQSVRERLYWGKCYTKEDLKKGIERFIEKKRAIFDLYQNFNFFSDASQNEAIDYLKTFYQIIEDEAQWTDYFIKNCKG